MAKTLSCKVPDHIYNFIDSMGKSHSDILRPLIIDYVNSLSNDAKKDGIPWLYQQTRTDEIDTIHEYIDALCRLKTANINDDVNNREMKKMKS